MIVRSLFPLLHASAALAICLTLEDCPQYAGLKTDACQPYHHFLARGSTSPYPGHLIETVGKVCKALNSKEQPTACGYEDLVYPALNGGDRWCQSAHTGALNGAAQMRNYTQRCPNSHLIVMGFSQGGSVQLDVLGGGGGELWGCNQTSNPAMNISTAPGSKIVAAVTFGATRRSADQNYTIGGGQISNGSAPRSPSELAGLAPYAAAGRLRDYCQPRDPICAPDTNNTDMSFHLDYFDKYGSEAALWVANQARKAAGLSPVTDTATSRGSRLAHPVAGACVVVFVMFFAL